MCAENDIGNLGVQSLSEALKVNKSITELNLECEINVWMNQTQVCNMMKVL